MADPTANPFARAFACAAVVFVAALAAGGVFMAATPYANEEAVYRALGGLLFSVIVGALVTGFFARSSAATWSRTRIVATFVAVSFVVEVLGLIASNRQRNDEQVERMVVATGRACRDRCGADQAQCDTMCRCVQSGIADRVQSPDARLALMQAARSGDRAAVGASIGDLFPRCAAAAGLNLETCCRPR
jgi:hypothetical protein